MAIQGYNTVTPRIGAYRARVLSHAEPVLALSKVGTNEDFKKNQGETMKFRRWLPKGSSSTQYNRFFLDGTGDRHAAYANQHLTTEGVTPAAESISAQDLSVSLNQYSVLYGYTDKTFNFYEDDVPEAMTQLTGERVGLVQESVLFGVLKGCTNKFYGGTGTTRATVNGTITLTGLRNIARSMAANHAKTLTSMERMGKAGMYGTAPVGRCFPVWVSTDLMPDLRELPGFINVEEYGDPSIAVENEVGKCEEFRFIASPDLVGIQDVGAAVAGTNPALNSTSGTYADVYQVIVGSQDAWGHAGLNLGKGSVTAIPLKQKDKNDPFGQRGYVGAIWHYNAIILNDLQMAVLECATRDLTA